MTAQQQQKRFGISVVPTPGGKVLFKIGNEEVAIPAPEGRRFTYELAHAYFCAENILRAQEVAA